MTYRALDFWFSLSSAGDLDEVLESALAPLVAETAVPHDEEVAVISVESDVTGTWTLDAPASSRTGLSPGGALAGVLEVINQGAAASVAHLVPLHAASVAPPGRKCLALVGRSGAGKSTLAAAAVLAGWGLVAEEISAVDPALDVVRPYHRPIGLRRGGAAAIGVAYPDSDDGRFEDVFPWVVSSASRRGSTELAAIVLVDRRSGDDLLEPVEAAPALAELVGNTVIAADRPVIHAFHGLDRLVRDVPVARLSYGCPDRGVEQLERFLAACR